MFATATKTKPTGRATRKESIASDPAVLAALVKLGSLQKQRDAKQDEADAINAAILPDVFDPESVPGVAALKAKIRKLIF